MQFIIIEKKENFEEQNIDLELLSSKYAPSLIAEESVKIEISNFIIYVYLYNHIIDERKDYSYYNDENKFLLANGVMNIDGNIRNKDINILFENLNEKSDIFGDYQLISIDANGNGFFKTPQFGIRQLFYYEDEFCSVLSNEIKLIADGVRKIKEKRFVENYDINFLYDSVFNEWGERKYPKKTIFKNIRRISPHDEKKFENGKIIIKEKKDIEVPKFFEEKFEKNRDSLYNEYYENIVNFTEQNLKEIKPGLEKIRMGLTGGYDSRLAVSILKPACDKLGINLETYTSGVDDHPDVVLADRISKSLKLNHSHFLPQGGEKPNPQAIDQYMFSFYQMQGDCNSNDLPYAIRRIDPLNSLTHAGMDAYKRYNMNLIYSGNRWFARQMLFKIMFFFPLFYTENEIFFALSYEKNDEDWKEFVYEILKRAQPELLEIPFIGEKIPNTNVEPYAGVMDSKFHEKMPFFWDYNLVKDRLSYVLKEDIDKKVGKKGKLLLKIIGLNELDFFMNPRIYKIINVYRKGKISLKSTFNKLLEEKKVMEPYKKNKSIRIKKDDPCRKKKRMMVVLMDYASAANVHSFEEIEKTVNFDKILPENHKYLIEH